MQYFVYTKRANKSNDCPTNCCQDISVVCNVEYEDVATLQEAIEQVKTDVLSNGVDSVLELMILEVANIHTLPIIEWKKEQK